MFINNSSENHSLTNGQNPMEQIAYKILDSNLINSRLFDQCLKLNEFLSNNYFYSITDRLNSNGKRQDHRKNLSYFKIILKDDKQLVNF